MASKLASLVVTLGLDSTEYDRELNRAAGKLRKLGDDLSQIGQTLTIGISAPVVALGGAAIKAAGSMEQAQVAFTTMLRSAREAQSFLQDLQRFAQRTPFEFSDLTDAAKRMMALGFAAKDVIPVMTSVGNAVGALGGGKELIDRIVLALGQMKAKGAVQAEEMRQLAEAGIPAWDALAQRLKVTVPEAMKMVEKRAVDSSTAISAVLSAMDERFAGGMEAQSQTLLGQWSNVKDKIFITLADIGKAMLPAAKSIIDGYVNPLLQKISELAAEFSKLPAVAQNATIGIGALAAALPPLIWALGTLIEKWGILAPVLVRVGSVLGTLAGAISLPATAAVAAAGAVAYLGNKMLDHAKAVDMTNQAIQRLNDRYYNQNNQMLKSSSLYESVLSFVRQSKPAHEEAAKAVETHAEKWKHLGAEMQGPSTALEQFTQALSAATAEQLKLPIDKGIEFWTKNALAAAGYRQQVEYVTAEVRGYKIAWETVQISDYWANIKMAVDEYGNSLDEATRKLKQYKIETDTFQFFDFSKGFPQTGDPNKGFEGGYAKPVFEEIKKDAQQSAVAMQEVSTVLNDLHKGLVDLMFDGGKFKDVMIGAAEGIGKSFARMVVTDLMKPFDDFMKAAAKWVADLATSIIKNLVKGAFGSLSQAIGSAISQLGGLGSTVAKIFGASSSAASSAVGAAGGLGGEGGLGGAGGGASGIIGAVTGVVTAVSSVIGNFQMAGMNKSLDLIVKHTLQTANQLIYGLQPQVNQYLPALSGIHDRLMEFRTSGIGVYPQAGYDWAISTSGNSGIGSVTLEINGGYFLSQRAMEDFFQAFMDFLRARGVKIG